MSFRQPGSGCSVFRSTRGGQSGSDPDQVASELFEFVSSGQFGVPMPEVLLGELDSETEIPRVVRAPAVEYAHRSTQVGISFPD